MMLLFQAGNEYIKRIKSCQKFTNFSRQSTRHPMSNFLQQTLPEICIQLNEKLLILQDDLPAFTYLHRGSYDEFS